MMQVQNKYAVVGESCSPSKINKYFDDQTALEIFMRTFAPLMGGTLSGAGIGGGIGFFSGIPGGTVTGGLIGGVTGLLVGLGVTGAINYPEYTKWLSTYKETEVFREFRQLNYEHEALEEFICPISMDIAFDPVRCPFGRLYDRSSLVRLSKERTNGTISDPYRNGDYTMAQVENAPDVLAKLLAVYKMLLEQELETDITSEVKSGMEALISDLDKQVKNYIRQETQMLTDKFTSNEIGIEEFGNKMNELTRKMSPELKAVSSNSSTLTSLEESSQDEYGTLEDSSDL